MAWQKDPAEKLSLAVRKSVRDKFESKKPEYESKIANFIGVDSWKIDINERAVFVYAEEGSYGNNNLGACIDAYVEAFVRKLGDYTKQGKDEEAKEVLRKVAKTNTLTMIATDKVSYCGVEITNGQFVLLFKHDRLASNISDVANDLEAQVDIALDALGENELPIVARRAIARYLTPTIAKLEEKMKKMFNKEYKFEYDIRETLKVLLAQEGDISWYKDRINKVVPEWTSMYFNAAVEKLESKNFGKDDMLQEAFIDATDKLVVRFAVVEKLQNGKTYNDTRFANGEYLLETVPKYFGSNVSDIGGEVIDRL